MQNRAGKGFNVGRMLSAVGKAGSAALPALEKAKEKRKLRLLLQVSMRCRLVLQIVQKTKLRTWRVKGVASIGFIKRRQRHRVREL